MIGAAQMKNYLNPSSHKWLEAARAAETAGHRPGSGAWMQAIRAYLRGGK